MQNKDTTDLELEKLEESDREKFEEKLLEYDGNPEEEENEEDMMASQLNPEAKEFVPISPQRSAPTSPLLQQQQPPLLSSLNGNNYINSQLLLSDDTVVAQSPRKGSVGMENIQVPSENEFETEISKRPHELEEENQAESEYINGVDDFQVNPTSNYQEMNLKEAMHGDEKQEIGYNDVIEKTSFDELNGGDNSDQQFINLMGDDTNNRSLLKEENTMNMSFYEGRDECILNNDSSEDPNKVQLLPVEFEEEQNLIVDENNMFVNENNIVNNSQIDVADEISRPEEDMYSPVTETKVEEFGDFVLDIVKVESDKPESELMLNETESVSNIEFGSSSDNKENQSVDHPVQSRDTDLLLELNLDNIRTNIQVEKSALSPTALEFSPSNKSLASNYIVSGSESSNIYIESLPESDDFKTSSVEDYAESDRCLQTEVEHIASAQPSFETIPSSNEQLVMGLETTLEESKSDIATNESESNVSVAIAPVVAAVAATAAVATVVNLLPETKSEQPSATVKSSPSTDTKKTDSLKAKSATTPTSKSSNVSTAKKTPVSNATAAKTTTKTSTGPAPIRRPLTASTAAKTTDIKLTEKKSGTTLTTAKKPPTSMTNGGDVKSTMRTSSAQVKSTTSSTTSAAKPRSASTTLASKTTAPSKTAAAPRPATLTTTTTVKASTTRTIATAKTTPTKPTLSVNTAKPKPTTPTTLGVKTTTTVTRSPTTKPRVPAAVKSSESTVKESKPRTTLASRTSALSTTTTKAPATKTASSVLSTATRKIEVKKVRFSQNYL